MKTKKAQKADKEQLSSAIPARLYESDAGKLRGYEEKGLNMSVLIRLCVRKALPDVVRELREELGKAEPEL